MRCVSAGLRDGTDAVGLSDKCDGAISLAFPHHLGSRCIYHLSFQVLALPGPRSAIVDE